MLVGLGADEVKVPLVSASIKEVDIRGTLRYATGWYEKASIYIILNNTLMCVYVMVQGHHACTLRI